MGGTEWVVMTLPVSGTYNSLYFTSTTTGFIAGQWGTGNLPLIMKTANGGSTWVEQPLVEVGILNSIFFVDSDIGYACGRVGLMLKTINGGIPVELTSFTASIYKNSVTLNWTTSTEINNQGFEIERTSSSTTPLFDEWTRIGFVPGIGTTTESQLYSFIDSKLNSRTYYYRLKQIDFDGTFEYSKELKVQISLPDKHVLEQNYPNPFNPSTVISWRLPVNSFVSIKIYDVLGNEVSTIVNKEIPAGDHEIEFSISSENARELTSGIYYYKLTVKDFSETKKMVYLK